MKMSDEDSDDDVMVVSTDEIEPELPYEGTSADTETRPLMQLLQRLVSNVDKQNTILTNAQIISILNMEFDIDITILHELEVEIYLNVVKRFLKDWSKWDEFDKGSNLLRKKKAYKTLHKTLELQYEDLKEFLRAKLKDTQPLAKDAVKNIIAESAKQMKEVDTSEITLEVHSSRLQLNELVLSQPRSEDVLNNILHLAESIPTSIVVNKLPLEAIFNWFAVEITIETKIFVYQRTTNHQLKHVLVNTKNGPRNINRVLNQEIQKKNSNVTLEAIDKEQFFNLSFNTLLKEVNLAKNWMEILNSLVEMAKKDMLLMHTLALPGTYRQYSNKYPYYRKLRKVVPGEPSTSFDLYIEETLAPMHVFNIARSSWKASSTAANPKWFTVRCVECKLKFYGSDICNTMREHFDLHHSNEPDWNCTNCEETFPMTELARNNWQHQCA